MSKTFLSEREGQLEFFDKFGIRDTELSNNTDGIYNGNIFEFKLKINNLNTVLFQALKYLNHMRVKGISIPANILLIDLNQETAYLFRSKDFVEEYINCPPLIGAASKNNENFSTFIKPIIFKYDNPSGIQQISELLQSKNYVKVTIDIYDVVGWANRFYSENPKATKIQLFEELRSPICFKDYIYPWEGAESDFKYIMDLLNDKMHRKELGAFYTPTPYCRKATELVRSAIKQLPEDHDYIILDRTAGTGNLEEFLTDRAVKDITVGELDRYIDKELKSKYLQDKAEIFNTFYSNKNFHEITIGELEKYKTKVSLYSYLSDNEISHVIVNTYELKEWIVLNERFGDKVKYIIPPVVEQDNALVKGGDALSDHFILGSGAGKLFVNEHYKEIIDELNSYVLDKKTNIILLENPPYRDQVADNGKVSRSFVFNEMTKVLKGLPNSNISTARDLSNQFIWSGWSYYLKKEDDYYILFSPIKYWKTLGLANRQFIDGFLFNRKHFHAGPSAISCVLWKNRADNCESLVLRAFDINTNGALDTKVGECIYLKDIVIKKVYKTFEPFFDRRTFNEDAEVLVFSEIDGTQTSGRKVDGKSVFNKNIIGYLRTDSFGVDPKHVSLTRQKLFNARGFYLRSDNYIQKLPLFAAKLYPQKNWYDRDIFFSTADGGQRYLEDIDFLKSCFIFSCLSQRNHCISFVATDGRYYRNELCFDEGTLAARDIKKYNLSSDEQDLMETFNNILDMAKSTANYNPAYSYGIYQIEQELNTRYKNDNDEWIYNYPELNGAISSIKIKLSSYYEKIIQPKIFEYELLK